MSDGKAEAERILMTRLTKCINADEHQMVPVDHLATWGGEVLRTPFYEYQPCPRCGIDRRFTYDLSERRVIALT